MGKRWKLDFHTLDMKSQQQLPRFGKNSKHVRLTDFKYTKGEIVAFIDTTFA